MNKIDLSEKPFECKKCDTKYGWLQSHSSEECTAIQLRQALAEIVKLKECINFWKDGWHDQREATGRVAWMVPNPYYLHGVETPFFQREWNRFVSFAQQLTRDGLIPLDDKPQEVTMREYVDPFDNIEE